MSKGSGTKTAADQVKREVVAVITEDAPWPLMYDIEVSDPKDRQEVRVAAIEARLRDLGDEDYLRETVERDLVVHFCLASGSPIEIVGDFRE